MSLNFIKVKERTIHQEGFYIKKLVKNFGLLKKEKKTKNNFLISERIRLSLGLDIAIEDDKVCDEVLNEEEEEDYFSPCNTNNTVVKTEPITYEIEKEFNEIETNPSPLLVDTNQSFEDKIMEYLQNKEIARQRRHDENMEVKKKQLLLLEKLCSSQK